MRSSRTKLTNNIIRLKEKVHKAILYVNLKKYFNENMFTYSVIFLSTEHEYFWYEKIKFVLRFKYVHCNN